MWEILSKFNAIAGFIGFFINIGTFILARRVNKRSDAIVDRVAYRNKYERHIADAKIFIDKIVSEEFESENLKIQINTFSADIKSRYSFLPMQIKKELDYLSQCDFNKLKTDSDYRVETINKLTELINHLKKESRK